MIYKSNGRSQKRHYAKRFALRRLFGIIQVELYNPPVYEIATHNLAKKFRRIFPLGASPVVAVDGVDLRIERGEIYGFLGPNGAGKTTTIKMMLGLVRPSAGSVEIPGGIRARDGRYRLGAVLEGNRNIYFRLTVAENLRYFGMLRGMKPSEIGRRTDELLSFFNLDEKRHATAQTLSRGMQQKLAFAAATIHDPEILLLDEPTLGLDVATARAIQVKLRELAHKHGKAILLTTHQMDLAQAVSDRVGIVNKGKLVAEDTVDGLMGLFKRMAYTFETRTSDIERVGLALSGFEHTISESRRPGQAFITVQLQDSKDVFRLTRALEAQGVIPERLSESVPNLEDVFISFTGEGAEGTNARARGGDVE